MKKFVFISVFFYSGFIALVSAQDIPSSVQEPDSIAVTTPLDLTPLTGLELIPLEFHPIGAPPETIKYDDSEIKMMHMKVVSEIPRYPTLRLWDGQYAAPFLYTSRNRYMGLDMAGIGTHIDITDWLAADVSAYLSGAYMGQLYPKRYMNASLSASLELKLHDRFSIYGMGEISAREGLHPKAAPGFGGKNSLGVMGVFWVTDNIGIGFGHTWEVYKGSWYGHYNYGPMTRPGK